MSPLVAPIHEEHPLRRLQRLARPLGLPVVHRQVQQQLQILGAEPLPRRSAPVLIREVWQQVPHVEPVRLDPVSGRFVHPLSGLEALALLHVALEQVDVALAPALTVEDVVPVPSDDQALRKRLPARKRAQRPAQEGQCRLQGVDCALLVAVRPELIQQDIAADRPPSVDDQVGEQLLGFCPPVQQRHFLLSQEQAHPAQQSHTHRANGAPAEAP